MPRLSEELRKKIREMQEKGVSDAEISRMTGVPYSTVRYQRPEVRERMRKRQREYRRRPEVRERRRERDREFRWKRRREEPALKEFLGILEGGAEVTADNVYVSILRFLQSTSDGKSYGQIERAVDSGRILRRLKDLRRLGLVNYEDRKYTLTNRGKELCKHLFNEDLKMLN